MFHVVSARAFYPGTPPSLAEHGTRHKDRILDAAEQHGAILLTDFERSGCADEFAGFSAALGLEPFDMAQSAAPRTMVAPHVFTANEAPSHATIDWHHELAQTRAPPHFVLFFAQIPALRGGATPICRSRDVASFVHSEFPQACAELRERRIKYRRCLPAETDPSSAIGKGWRQSFGASRALAEARMRRDDIQWRWLPCEELVTYSPPLDFFGVDSQNRTTFFNSVVTARSSWNDARNRAAESVVYADTDEALSVEVDQMLRSAAAYMDREAWRGTWKQAGDLLLIDNTQTLHARDPFTGPRRVLTSLWGARPR